MIIKFLSSIPCIRNFSIYDFYPRIENGMIYFFYAFLFYTTFDTNYIINNKIKCIIFIFLYNIGFHSKLN